jgi:hypothetical protein
MGFKGAHSAPQKGRRSLTRRLSHLHFFLLSLLMRSLLCPRVQTETYQLGGAGQTHGTDGPLKVSMGGAVLDIGTQFLQVAGALDPSRAPELSDGDANDLSTINVFTVSALHLSVTAT